LRKSWVSIIVCVVLIGGLFVGLLVVTHAPTSSSSPTAKTTTGCANATNGVILSTDVNYQGQWVDWSKRCEQGIIAVNSFCGGFGFVKITLQMEFWLCQALLPSFSGKRSGFDE
jgi:hypothetical protein